MMGIIINRSRNTQELFSYRGMDIVPEINAASGDSRYIRELGIAVFGFSPINNTPIRLHADNECLNVSVFLRGIEIYFNLIQALANIKE